MQRLKKILKWTGIVLGGLVVIGLVANAVFIWTTDARLENQLAAIRKAGDPVTLAELAPKPISPEKNAATYLRQAEADTAAIEKETTGLHPASECSGFLIPPEDRKKIKAALNAYPKAIPLLERAAACQDYDAQLDYTLSSEEFLGHLCNNEEMLQKSRGAARVLRVRATLLVAEGNRDEAVRTALVIFRLAHHFDRNPTLVGYLVAIAVRGYAIASANEALQTGPVSKGVREALDTELVRHERMDGYTWALKSERAFVLDSFRNIVPGRNFWLFSRGHWNLQESACLEVFPTLISLASDPGSYRKVEQTIEGKKSVMAALLFPALNAEYVAVTRTRAELRCLRVLNALRTRVPAGSKGVPKLTDLGLPTETITDPFTGKPLHVKKTPQGWLVYSVGPNFKDDGGKLDDPINGDVGVGPPPPVPKPAKDDQKKEEKANRRDN
jgi:hypothetical protein